MKKGKSRSCLKNRFGAPLKVRLAFSICIGAKPVKRHLQIEWLIHLEETYKKVCKHDENANKWNLVILDDTCKFKEFSPFYAKI